MREAGAATFAQDERSSVVWGMPGASVHLGAVEQVLPIEAIADQLMQAAISRGARHRATA